MSRAAVLALLGVLALLAPLAVAPGAGAADASAAADGASPAWDWPLRAPRIVRGYVRPPHPYGAGHRGIDLTGTDDVVRAPADGVVAFAGDVAGRPVLTIDHGDGWVSSFEPVATAMRPGTAVLRGQQVGEITASGHGAPGVLHLGARRDGEYVNPLLLLGGVPRAVLLPCC
ncbi:murein hydrolase activator EnvC [Microbacterium sp. SORGH_AS_0888]|uniref:murein hydrolase activator EnvC family protein n=1 Tax=Microbacterium sp. SORGH_AS_0888 TaxID=3041791 RepID=UPI002787F8C9|nr:M23 family metallopeptidase [Microbacterium sp. SORGH_AS_0888]MDQ1128791.1 murein DD-endopeptidase MepM/ murein hydrolase activator NlpD [Microbacterium sp. SORGH_AS_0888]